MADSVAFIVFLFVAGVVAIIVEMIVPGVILGVCGAGCVVAAIVMAYSGGATGLGHTLLIIAIMLVPFFFVLWVKVLSHFLTQREVIAATVTPQGREDLSGKQGVTLTKLRPSGTARIDGLRVDVMARGEIIEANTRVEVVAVEGNRVVVREVRA